MDPLCFSLTPVWARDPGMGCECCLQSDLQTPGILILEGTAFPLQPCTARGSGHFAYIGAKVWERVQRCVSQGTQPCPVREPCSWGGTFPHLTSHHSQCCKSPDMVKMQKHFSPVHHIFENRRQASTFPFLPFLPPYARFMAMKEKISGNSLCHRKSIYEIKSKFTD